MSQQNLRYVSLYLFIAAATAAFVHADETPDPKPTHPTGEASAISEWALAGSVWSEANLVKKLAVETARQGVADETQMQTLKAIAVRAEALVEDMETFGWRRVRRLNGRDDTPVRQPNSDGVPEPEVIGKKLAESMGIEPKREQNATKQNATKVKPNRPAVDPQRALLKSRFDRESPAGMDDPGIDDEFTRNNLRIDIDQYRVDDYIDETPIEARNRADAIEDGVEGAIAAASDEGIAGPTSGRISYRESQTRSATLPYSKDSIYDADDYDPDVDYDVENRLTPRQINTDNAEMTDGDDEISLRKPAIAVEGEDEMVAAIATGGTAELPVAPPRADRLQTTSPQPTSERLMETRRRNQADANWVQLQLEWNQNRWDAMKNSLSVDAVESAMMQLEITMATVRRASDSERLRTLLN